MELLKVEGHKGLGKDPRTGAVVNTDRESLMAARKRKAAILQEKEKLKTLEARVAQLEKLVERALGESYGD